MSKLVNQIAKLEAAREAAAKTITSIDEQLAELRPQAAAEATQAEARRLIDVDGLAQATQVAYDFGRGEKRRRLIGLVSAFNPETKKYRILCGAGFDAELHTVSSSDIVGVL